MAKKNRNKKKKKKKESYGSTGNVNGGSNSSSNNNNSNNNNNDMTIPTVATTTTTEIVLTTRQLDLIDNKWKLAGYPTSHFFTVGYELKSAGHIDAAIDAFKRGADNDGCVPCMLFYVVIQHQRGNFHLLLPYAIEGAIRGHIGCMDGLIECYNNSKPVMAITLGNFWLKTKIEFGDNHCTEEKRKELKKTDASKCHVCGEKDLEDNDVTLVKCGKCKHYSYCGKKCQTRHWQEGKHMNECRQVILLRKYCKPSYVKEIREAIIGGVDPKEIHRLQRLRTKLGLNRPKEDYEELLLRLGDDNDSTIQDRYHYLTARKDGTVWIGSTP